MKHIEYPSIEQFRNVVSNVKRAKIISFDPDGQPIYERQVVAPKIVFKGSVKLHGSNAALVFHKGSVWIQSRTQIITPENDNAGFAKFATERAGAFKNLFDVLTQGNDPERAYVIYGEWAGANIQKNVAISNLPKSFYIFDACSVNLDDNEMSFNWLSISELRDPDNLIFNIEDYPTWEMEIDFENPGLSQNDLARLTIAVEEECPVGKAHGFSGVGEGIVWKTLHNGERFIFKVKGEKHSVSKVKTLAEVDTVKLNGIKDFVDYAVTDNRLNQAIQTVFGELAPNINKMGDVIRWMVNDVTKEETDTMQKSGLSTADVNKAVSAKTRQMFVDVLNSEAGII